MPLVSLQYQILPREAVSELAPENRITRTLETIAQKGSIAEAAKALHLSYRQLWNLLNQWEAEIGSPLLVRGRGKSCRLSDFSRRWLAAEQEVKAKHAMALQALRADLEQAFVCAGRADLPLVTLSGCPDEALELLREDAPGRDFVLEINFNSSEKGLAALEAGQCQIAGFNFPLGQSASSSLPREFRKHLGGGELLLLSFCTRIQGLAVQAGNPLLLGSMLSIAQKKARYINRAKGTGTRILCDSLLRTVGLSPDEIPGYGTEAPSHQAVAVAIASGKADAGLCIQSVAERTGLSFIPLVKEAYCLALSKSFAASREGRAFLKALASGDWRRKTAALPGYDFKECGEILSA